MPQKSCPSYLQHMKKCKKKTMAKCNIKRGKSRAKTTKRGQKIAATKAEREQRTEKTENNNNGSKAKLQR